MTCVLGPRQCALVELLVDGNVLLLKAYIPVFEQGPDCHNSCSSSSEAAVCSFGDVAQKDLLEDWALTILLKYGKYLLQIFKYQEKELRNMLVVFELKCRDFWS